MVGYLVYLYFLGVHTTDLTTSLESKYNQAAIWDLLPGYIRPYGKRMYPLAAMVANITRPTLDCPALMHHDNVVMFVHEMGRVLHGLLSRLQFSRIHETRVARDFVD